MIYLLFFACASFLTWLITAEVRNRALAYDITDKPIGSRKIHTRPMPLLGGVGIYTALALLVIGYFFFAPPSWPTLTDTHVLPRHIFGILIAGFFLMVGGALDDRYILKPYQQVIWPILAACIIIASGIGVEKLTNPFGGYIYLDKPLSDLLTFFWLLLIIYTTKFLDGLDGLVS